MLEEIAGSQEAKDLLIRPFTSARPKMIKDNDGILEKSTPTTDGSPATTVAGRPLNGIGLEANTLPCPVGSTLPLPERVFPLNIGFMRPRCSYVFHWSVETAKSEIEK
ncbi:hypothetical protein M9H77_23698 [Catharanthus roseus]|uniref:Uncharacterized protein n=1 Tax=Catharanthus roseus TaxID=4058 RepID=A0ACC0AU25_CATRO|nr:hypothetical protein M9H77_23698 [Catharanthus roseus]